MSRDSAIGERDLYDDVESMDFCDAICPECGAAPDQPCTVGCSQRELEADDE